MNFKARKQNENALNFSISKKDLNFIKSLIEQEYTPFKFKYDQKRANSLHRLSKIFHSSCIEEIARKAIYHNLIDTQKIKLTKKYLNHINDYSIKRINIAIKFRRSILKEATNAPSEITDFCLNWKNNKTPEEDENLLANFKLIVKNDCKIKIYMKKIHNSWKKLVLNTRVEFRDIFTSLFDIDKIYEKNAYELSKKTSLFSLESLYLIKNFINDNFPVTTKRKLDKQEKSLIKFLLYKGDEISYIEQHNISWNELNKIIKSICDTYECNDINHVLNLILIEKYLKNENAKFLKLTAQIQRKENKYI